MELKEKAIELAEHLNDLGIVKFENITMLERHNFEQVVSQILQELQNKYPDTKLKRRMKSVHYAMDLLMKNLNSLHLCLMI